MSRVAFITGASSGLGAGLARRLAKEGFAVGLAARRVDRLESVAVEVEAVGARPSVCRCDVRQREQVRAAVSKVEEELGPVDLLVANAGVSERTYVESLDSAEVERMIRTNFLGAVYATEAVLPGMLERSAGRVVAVGSLAGYGGLPKTAGYSASKGALHNFFESLRIDLRGTGVDVTVITPGYVRTEMTADNLSPMPYLLELDDAVERMYRAITTGKKALSFPWQLSALTWLGQVLPAGVYDRLAGGMRRDRRDQRS